MRTRPHPRPGSGKGAVIDDDTSCGYSHTMTSQPPTPRRAEYDEMLSHGNTLLRYALARVGDRATAEDLVQDTLVVAVKKADTFSGDAAMQTWLIGILRHKILDHFRWKKRHPGDPPSYDDERQQDDPDPWFTPLGAWRADPNVGLEALDGDPAKALERTQLRAALKLCIEHLPKKLHRVFVLRELEEMEPDETCEIAGIGPGSLAVFLYRARQALRTCLQKKWVAS